MSPCGAFGRDRVCDRDPTALVVPSVPLDLGLSAIVKVQPSRLGQIKDELLSLDNRDFKSSGSLQK
jgi:hypothetical protein